MLTPAMLRRLLLALIALSLVRVFAVESPAIDEHARHRSLKGGGVYRERMDLRLTPKGSTMDISTFLVFIVGLGAMLAAELAP